MLGHHVDWTPTFVHHPRCLDEAVVQLLMETDVDGLIPRSVNNALALRDLGAGRHERSSERTTYRNGYRDRTLDTRLGSLQPVSPFCGLIPKLRQGSYVPPVLKPRKTTEQALVAVIQEAWRKSTARSWLHRPGTQ